MAARLKGSRPTCLMLQSVEARCDLEEATVLLDHLKQDTLVVGKRLDGHDFGGPTSTELGPFSLNGTTTPWNTLALWNLSRLALTGFLLVAEGFEDGVAGGVEEVSVIALHQKLWPELSKAKLVDIISSKSDQESWRTNWSVSLSSATLDLH